MTAVRLESVVDAMPRGSTERDLAAAWDGIAANLGLDAAAGRETLFETARDVTLLSTGQLDPAVGGGWRWNLSEAAVRTVCTATLLAAVLAAAGIPGLPPLVIPTVLPLLFDLKRVRLERREERVIRIFGVRPDAVERRGRPTELYASLPEATRRLLPYGEFVEFLDRAVDAGVAKARFGVYEVLPDGETVLRLTLE
jgi:hypothetical protein